MQRHWRQALLVVVALSVVGAAGRSAAANESTPPARSRLPPAKGIDGGLYYHSEARRLGREGRVEFEFNIGATGRANHVTVLLADDRALAPDARELLEAIRFDVPADWQSSGLGATRYRLGMVFCLPPSGQSERFPEAISIMIITAERIPGSPVRHPVQPGAYGRCAQPHPQRG